MEEGIEEQMLEALELFHYVHRFREKTFAVIPREDRLLIEILSDLRVLQASDIHLVICCRYRPGLEGMIDRLNSFGHEFRLHRAAGDFPRVEQLRREPGVLPVVALDCYDVAGTEQGSVPVFQRRAVSILESLGVSKVFLPGRYPGLSVDNTLRSYITGAELDELLENATASFNVDRDYLQFIGESRDRLQADITLLEGKSGELFREVFTHRGAGTLFSSDYENVIRRARRQDVGDIYFLMKPYLAARSILPIEPSELTERIGEFFVYEVNGQIVATVSNRDFGEAVELGKLCTLPRYQRRGRARLLARHLLDAARANGKRYVFALSTGPEMGEFFMSLGFAEVPRESLPEAWKRKYDFSRPSRAYRFEL